MYRILLASVLVTASLGAAAQDQPALGPPGSTAYVFASRANLRVQPQPGANVLAQPVTNTRVTLVASDGEWCEVDTTAARDAPAQRGFVACNLLRAQPLALATITTELDSARRSGKGVLDWESRGFWVAPSLLRFRQVALALEGVHLTPEIRNREISGAKALRFKVPEFEAMKQRLAAGGVVVAPEAMAEVPFLLPRHLASLKLDAPLARASLPTIKASFFRIDDTPVLDTAIRYSEPTSHRAIRLADALSARNAAPFDAVVTGPAVYALGPQVAPLALRELPRFVPTGGPLDVIIGVWDVGGLRVSYGGAAHLHGVNVRGEPTREKVLGLDVVFGVDYGCGGSARVEVRGASVAGYAKPASALVRWAGAPIPGGAAARAQIKSRKFDGTRAADRLVTHEIDLNGDGVADFVVWQGRYEPQISGDGLWSAVFANIGGEWRLLSYDQEEDCT